MTNAKRVRLGAVADIHCTKKAADNMRDLLSAMAHETDILLLGGDLCDAGLPEEAEILAREIAALKVPVVAVLGNHDFEAGKSAEIVEILSNVGVNVLDGKSCEIYGVGFAGAKGFVGLRTPHRIALLHYSPIVETVVGEPPEIFPFLGSSRLEDPLNRYSVSAVFHGHAHRGSPEGSTKMGVRVFNVAQSLLQSTSRPFKIFEIDGVEERK